MKFDRYRRCKACGDYHWLSEWPANHVEPGPPLRLLEAPMVIRDGLPDLFHPCDNQHYDSKREFRKVTKAHGREEIGNDPIKDKRWVDRISAADVAEAKQMVDQGYRPHNETATADDTASVIATAA